MVVVVVMVSVVVVVVVIVILGSYTGLANKLNNKAFGRYGKWQGKWQVTQGGPANGLNASPSGVSKRNECTGHDGVQRHSAEEQASIMCTPPPTDEGLLVTISVSCFEACFSSTAFGY